MTIHEKVPTKAKRPDDSPPTPGGRWPAGEDPAKRKQILDGARNVFMSLGFDAASMNDVTREAGVSKGTLYVYFSNKEELFSAMIEAERAAFLAKIRDVLSGPDDVEAGLYKFGINFIMHMTDEKVISAMRIVLGVRERMPTLCQRFFKGPENLRTVMRDFLERHIAAGELTIDVDDIDLAAGQYLDLASGSFFKLRLFGTMDKAPPIEEIDHVIRGAVRVFMAAYGVKKAGSPDQPRIRTP
jgi:AcrR family transcriptional regulator